MKLLGRRGPRPEVDESDIDLLFYLFALHRDAMPAYRALRGRRAPGDAAHEIAPEALAWARGLPCGQRRHVADRASV